MKVCIHLFQDSITRARQGWEVGGNGDDFEDEDDVEAVQEEGTGSSGSAALNDPNNFIDGTELGGRTPTSER
jgi:hypothetical protein